jgi:hypothetical protein
MLAIVMKVLWVATVLAALMLLARGLFAGVYFERTEEAVAEAHRGAVLVGVACSLLLLAAAYAVVMAGWPVWVGGALLAPVLLCGGLTLFAPETLLPMVAVLVAFPVALTGAVGGLLADVHGRLGMAGVWFVAVVLGVIATGTSFNWFSKLAG